MYICSIGSLGGGGFDVVENVRVRNCTLKNTITGVRIKSVQVQLINIYLL